MIGDCLGTLLFLAVAAAVGWFADLIIPGKMPYGWIGGIIAALVGGIVGGFLFGGWGPGVNMIGGYTYYIIPALLGTILGAFAARVLLGMMNKRAL
jgi:uncharacterized membrane protein YeaQ/YmgE (transglycosylase-associated protein family)